MVPRTPRRSPTRRPAPQPEVDRLPWSAREDALIVKHYASTGTRSLAVLLPARTRAAISARARALGVKAYEPAAANAITEKRAKELLAEAKNNVTKAAKLCAVPAASFHRRLVTLGLVTPRDTGHWSGADLAVLRQYYRTESIEMLRTRLPNRTPEAIRKQCARLAKAAAEA
jgi:hypothetical protein